MITHMNRETKKSDAGFLVQGSILAAASIISRIVGLLYRVPLTRIIGKTGNDYYGTAFEIYSIILIISSYSIPLAVSKLVAARMVEGEVKNAYRVLKGALLFATCTGGTAALVVFFGADFFAGGLLNTPLAAIALRVLAPVIFIVAILGVLRGFFQGLNTMIPSAVSQIAEQIVNAAVSVGAAYYLVSYGMKVGAVLGNAEDYAAAYGAAGGTLGTALGAVTALLFMWFVFSLYRKRFLKKVQRDRNESVAGYGEVMRLLVVTIIPVLLSTTLYNISAIIDTGIFKNMAAFQGYSEQQIHDWWGVFTGQYRVIINVPVSIASAIAASSVPSLTTAYQSGDEELVRSRIHSATRFIMMVAFPCTVGAAVLSGPIMQLLFRDSDATSAWMLAIGSISILFYSLSTLSNGLLQGIDKMHLPVRNAAISLVLQAGLLYLLMQLFHLNIYSVIFANAFYALLMCVLNGMGVRKYSGVKQDIKTTYLLPAAAAVIMGVFTYGAYRLVYLVSQRNAISTLAAMVVAMFAYFVPLLLLKAISREELLGLPKGELLVKVAEKMRLLRE